MTAIVASEGERVWIEGVPSLTEFGKPVCTFAGSLAAALSATSHPLSAEDILALSGYAFHTRWCHSDGHPTGCPGSVSLEQGFLLHAFSKHSGWKLKILIDQGWDTPGMQRAVPDIIASIDTGQPVVIEDKHIDAAVLYGYVNQGERFLLNSYREGHIEAALPDLSQDPAYAFILTEHIEPPPFSDVFRNILDNAVTWWHMKHEPNTCGGPGMRIGRTALEGWAQFYGSIDALSAICTRGKGELLYNSLMNYQHLYENRKAAVGFLSKHAQRFPSAQDVIGKAAEAYRQEVEALASALNPDDDVWRKFNRVRTTQVSRSLASMGWEETRSVEPPDVWTPEIQQRERQIMEQALRLERSAIEHLEQARDQISQ